MNDIEWNLEDFPKELFVKVEESYLREIISSIGSQHEVARQIGIKHPMLHRYLRGRRISLERLSNIIDLSPERKKIKKGLESNIIDIKAPSSRALEIKAPFPLEMNKSFARILGHLLADGNIRRNSGHNVRYGNTDPVLVESFVKDMKSIFNEAEYHKRIKTYETKNGERKFTEVTYPSTIGRILLEIFDYPGTFEGRVPEVILESEEKIISEFLKVFFDDEGTITGNCFKIQIANKTSIHQIKELFHKLGVEVKLNSYLDRRTTMYSLSIYKKKLQTLFWEKIGATENSRKYLQLKEYIKKSTK